MTKNGLGKDKSIKMIGNQEKSSGVAEDKTRNYNPNANDHSMNAPSENHP